MSFPQFRDKSLKADRGGNFLPFKIYDRTVDTPTNNAAFVEESSNRGMARDSKGYLYAVYNAFNPATTFYDIRISRSTDGGQTWAQDATVYSYASNSLFTPKIAIDSTDKIWIAHEGYGAPTNPTKKNIHLIYGTFGGVWTHQNVTDLPDEQFVPGIAVDGNDNVHLTWYGIDIAKVNTGFYQIRYVKVLNNGTIGSIVTLTDEPASQGDPTIAIDRSNNIHIAWYGIYTGDANWQFSYIKNTSGSWGSRQQVSTAAVTHLIPALVLDSSGVPAIVGFNFTQKIQEYYANVAGVWQSPETIESIGAQFQTYKYISLAIDQSDTLHVLYNKGGALNSNADVVRYSKRPAGGAWTSPQTFNNDSYSPFPGKEYQIHPTSMFAVWPVIQGNSTNIPLTGMLGMYIDNDQTNSVSPDTFSGNLLGIATLDLTWRTSRTIQGVSNISSSATTTKTITGIARVQLTTSKTISGVGRVTGITSKAITGVARVQVTVSKTITGVARLTGITSKTITGVSRITTAATKTITGVARITSAASKTITGVARITATASKTFTGVARITATTLKTVTGVARITKSASKTETGVARIQVSTSKTETGISRVTASASKTETGVARVTASTLKTVSGVSRIQVSTLKTETGLARINATTKRTITGVANITGGAVAGKARSFAYFIG